MIYLFDDKINRQKDAGWDEQRFVQFSKIIKPIYLYSEVQDDLKRREIFSSGNIILFHESFFDNVLNKHHKDGIAIRNKLNYFAAENKDFRLIFFSGSINSRSLNDNVGHVPVSILYQNLDIFCSNVKLDDVNLHYLLYGANYKIEEILLQELNKANNQIEDIIENASPDCQNFIAVTQMGEIELPFNNADYETFFTDDIEDEYNNDIDKYCTSKIKSWFTSKDYDNIFIPISFGPTLSDFNGLRFATHIRCTDSLNRLKNIFVYSFIGYEYVVRNEYFDILKTKNVFLIGHNKSAFANALNLSSEPLALDELPKEIKKIKIEIPKSYEDNHSITNEWAIYRWALSINTNDDDIEQIIRKVNNQLYFKYLATIFPKEEIKKIPDNEMKILFSDKPKVLYIDDDADKGWYGIFCKILFDINKLDLCYLDEEFNSKTPDEIIKISIDTILREEIDLVILDLRLHPNDFKSSSIDEITGMRLLKQIKFINPGIQVIVFSATNKIWNLQALQLAKADGFITKESPENSNDNIFTYKVISNFCKVIEKSLDLRYLKSFYGEVRIVSEILLKKVKKNELPKDFVEEYLKWLEFSINNLLKYKSNEGNIVSFLMFFSVLENLANRIIDIDNPEKFDEFFKHKYRRNNTYLKYFNKNDNGSYSRTAYDNESKSRHINWDQKLLNTIYYLSNSSIDDSQLSVLIKKRNDIVHSNSTTGDKIEISVNELKLIFRIITQNAININ
jgi:CheY-like chemotaxis protein